MYKKLLEYAILENTNKIYTIKQKKHISEGLFTKMKLRTELKLLAAATLGYKLAKKMDRQYDEQ